jgi:hypothetical protein
MLARLIGGIPGVPLMVGYMVGLEADGWETIGVGHKMKQETMGVLPVPMTQLGMGTVAPTNRSRLLIGSKSIHG